MTTEEQVEAVRSFCRQQAFTCEGATAEDAVHAANDVKQHVLQLLSEEPS